MKISDYSKKRIKKLKEIYNDYVREEDKELIRLTKEVDRLNNIINELIEDTTYLLEIIYRNEPYIEVYQDESIAIESAEEKIKELKGSDKE